jgi:F-type H+-transporting ATPase subunit delta
MKAKQYAEALHLSIHEVRPEDQDKVLDNLVKIMAQNGDLGLYDQIEAEYSRLNSTENGIKQVEITSANPVQSQELLRDLNKIVGEKTEVKQKIDQSLIGGVVVRVDDTLIDASVKNSLAHLKNLIAKN